MDGIPHNGLCALLMAGTAMCAWTGATGTTPWENGGNWSEAHAPSQDEGALFQNTTHPAVQINAPTTIRDIVFAADAPAYTIALAPNPTYNALMLAGDGVRNDSAVTQTFALQTAPGGMPSDSAPGNTSAIVLLNTASASSGSGRVRYIGNGVLFFAAYSTAGNADIDMSGTVGFHDALERRQRDGPYYQRPDRIPRSRHRRQPPM